MGEDLEHFTNDFDTVMEKRFEKFPSLVAAVAEVFDFRRVSFLSESYDGGSSSGDRDGTDRSAVDCQKVYAG